VRGIFASTVPGFWHTKTTELRELVGWQGPIPGHDLALEDDRPVLLPPQTADSSPRAADARGIWSTDGSTALAIDGELRVSGIAESRSPHTSSNVQYLADLLAGDRSTALVEMAGAWAFVGWNAKRQELFAARDPYGVKPLYALAHADGGVSIASQIAPLLLSPEVRELDEQGLSEYLTMGHTGPNRTIYRAITKLFPGRLYRWRRDSGAPWRMSIEEMPATRKPTLKVTDAVAEAVATRTADAAVGCFISGGAASTLLTALAATTVPSLQTFSVSVPSNEADDECDAAERNALLLGTKHTVVPASVADLGECAWTLIRHQGEPSADPLALPLMVLSRHASQFVEVVLAGDGAEPMFAGPARSRAGGQPSFLRSSRVGLRRAVADRWARGRRRAWQISVVEAGLRNAGSRAPAALLDGDVALLAEVRPTACADLLARATLDCNAKPRAGKDDIPDSRFYLHASWVPDQLLDTTQRAAASTTLDVRLPYLDSGVEAASAHLRRRCDSNQALREALTALAPEVRPSTRMTGSSGYRDAVVHGPLADAYRYELESGRSVIGRWLGAEGQRTVAMRAAHSGRLQYRLSVLGVWEHLFDAERYACPS
jgi:asparagine synthase (glutamine-hydrolysing)